MFNYSWQMRDGFPAPGIQPNNKKVFGTFICGGGSTMGYKLAGYTHLGGVEIDKRMAAMYKINHNPKYLYLEDLRHFNNRTDLDNELYNLDLLDGSPPCSTFSVSGLREKSWGKEKKFREGQKSQRLDDLVFVYCDTIKKLKPKIFLLENVKGMIQGNAKAYTRKIVETLQASDYKVQIFLLNAASMGVPQRRERVFIIGHKKNYNLPKLNLSFNERPIVYGEIEDDNFENKIANCALPYVEKCKPGTALNTVHPKNNLFNTKKLAKDKVCNTVASGAELYHYSKLKALSNNELKLAGTFPGDYLFNGNEPKYVIGMSVPPVMTAHIANQIFIQWLKKM